jgi:rhodanese-related sulfurtransferase
MVDQIRPAQLSTWLAAHPGATVLDVREAWELQTASVKPAGFALSTIPMQSIPGRIAELDADAPIACLCHHGMRSQQVALFLSRNGFGTVVNIAGGIDAWSAELDGTVPRY